MQEFCLEEYLSNGVEHIVKGILKMSFANPKESVFLMQYAQAEKQARALRRKAEARGEHIPPFLIASITKQCNLQCAGCYARANHACQDMAGLKELTKEQWGRIFSQAGELGISFILLAGGEPFTRKEVLKEAGRYKNILFPVFTNGTLMEEAGMKLCRENRNLIPILSIEGGEVVTDQRRGAGVYQKLQQTMADLQAQGILFGASVTVTKENLKEVLSEEFTKSLEERGCRAVIYVEYVPADKATVSLALGEEERKIMEAELEGLRSGPRDMIFISFPGDEKVSGGCLAAGRGFFHINAEGGAEPCPFSPYSDTSLRYTSLRDALQSPLFQKLQSGKMLTGSHTGGCVLFEQEEKVKEYIKEQAI